MADTWTFTHELEVRFRDCDSQAHVNNAVYFTYLEQCRVAFWRRVSEEGGSVFPRVIVARAECDYRAQAVAGERLEIRMRVDALGRSSFHLAYEIVRAGSGERVAEAKTVMVTCDRDSGRPIPMPDWVRVLLARYAPAAHAV